MSVQQINFGNATLKAILENPDSKVQLNIANSLWVRQGFPLIQDFLQRNPNFYKAKVTSLDFKESGGSTLINN